MLKLASLSSFFVEMGAMLQPLNHNDAHDHLLLHSLEVTKFTSQESHKVAI
jgi:hypothetical protein